MTTRLYLVFENAIKIIGSLSVKRFPEAAAKKIPRLIVYFDKFNGNKYISRLHFDLCKFDEEGFHVLDSDYINHTMTKAYCGDKPYGNNVTSMLDYQKIKLTDTQKKLLSDRLEKDFGDTWKRMDTYKKALLWAKGDTGITY
jgi:hypothetical protein